MTQKFYSWVYIQKTQKHEFKNTQAHCVHSSIIYKAKKWQQPKCPSTDEWIMKHTHTHMHTHNGIYSAF